MKILLLTLIVLFAQSSLANLLASGEYTKIGTWSDLNGHGGIAVLQWTHNGAIGVNHGTFIDTSTTGTNKYPDIVFDYTYQFVSMDSSNRIYDVMLKGSDGRFSSIGNMKSNVNSYITTLEQADPTGTSGEKMKVVEQGVFSPSRLSRIGSITLSNGNVIFYSAFDIERTELKKK